MRQEYELYRKLGPAPGLPKVLYFGECQPYDVLVLELLGPSLERVFNSCSRRFSLRTTTHIAVQILEIIRYIHSQKIIFCNVKPENFCLGRPNSPKANQVHLIGFTHARPFVTEQLEHISKRSSQRTPNSEGDNYGHQQQLRQQEQQQEQPEKKVEKDNFSSNPSMPLQQQPPPTRPSSPSKGAVFGTPRYMSLNAHKGKVLSRRDDLESIGYMLLYFLQSKLPWQGLQMAADCHQLEKYERIYSLKKSIRLEELCTGLPAEYYHYMLYARTLQFAQEPNYRYLLKMFSKLLHRIDDLERASSQFTAVYDWDEQQPIIGSNSFSRGQQQQREMVVPASPVPSTAPTTISSSENLQVPRSPSGPLRKQVSFKEEHESVSITADDYFPFVRNAAYAEDYLRQTYGSLYHYAAAAATANAASAAVSTSVWGANSPQHNNGGGGGGGGTARTFFLPSAAASAVNRQQSNNAN